MLEEEVEIVPLLERLQLPDALCDVRMSPNKGRQIFTASQLEGARESGFSEGFAEAQKRSQSEIAELQKSFAEACDSTFSAVAKQHFALFEQFQMLVPELVMEAVARVLARTRPDRDMITRIVRELLEEIAPSAEPVEVQLPPGDLELLKGVESEFAAKHPALKFRANPELNAGDAVIRSRFGVIDGRLSAKFRLVSVMFQ